VTQFEFSLRRMARGDLKTVLELETIIFPTPWSMNSYEFELERNPASKQWVIEAQGGDSPKIAAYCVCWLLGDELHIANLAVAPEFRRLGLGRRLLAHMLDRAAEAGLHSATLEVRAGNLAAQALYETFGFHEAARRKGYYRDNHEDALLMQLTHISDIGKKENSQVVQER
jgi:[ribosomal protein S18]-alanine N-acetyltransferase